MAEKLLPICKRADSPEQKNARRKAILRVAAAELARSGAAEDLTIEALSRKIGLAKGTVYLYFPSKNALFLALLLDALESLLTDISRRLIKLPSPVSAVQVAHAIRDAIGKSSRVRQLPRLLRSLSENKMKSSSQAFKERIHPCLKKVDAILVQRLEKLRPGDGRRIIDYAWAMHLGLSQMAENRAKKQHCREPRVEGISTDPEQALGDGLTLLIEGYLARSGGLSK
jgi:AcrR family transcriptional regulator